jgi:hypothetical protein
MPYTTIFVLVACTSFFAQAAEDAGRSRATGAMASLGAWIVFTYLFWGGIVGGLVSQALLFAGWGAAGILRDWFAERRKA